MFQVGGIGPMMGQAMYFQRIAALNGENNQFSIKRYVDESRRLFEVLDKQLASHEFIVSNEFTIADIATYPWARTYYWANVPEHLKFHTLVGHFLGRVIYDLKRLKMQKTFKVMSNPY